MKTLYAAIMLLVSLTINAQNPIDKTVGEFNEIKVYDRIEVELIKGETNKVVISGKNTNDLVVVNKNGILKIRMTVEESFDGGDTVVKVYYTHIDIIDANEGSFIASNSIFEQFDLQLRAQEGGRIQLQVKDLKFLDIKSISGGSIAVSGNSQNQNVDINTGGAYQAEDLITDKTEVVIQAAGVAHVHAKKEMKATVRAGGSVYIYGNPELVDDNKIFGGKIIIKD